MTTPEWLKVAARRSAQDPASLGYVFEQYRKHECKSAEELAAMLGCSLEVLDGLSLCRRPEQQRFAEHLRMSAERFAVDPRRLAAVLKRVEVLDVLPTDGEGGTSVLEDSYLMTAQDTAEANIQETVRTEVLGKLQDYTRLDLAGVYPASEERLRTVFEALLFPGRVEAVASIVASHDSLPLGITQLGVAVVGYGSTCGTFSQRLFRKELSTGSEAPVRVAMECMGERHKRSGMGHRDMLSMLARRGLRDYSERVILLDKAQAEWRIGQGNPCSRELLSGSGYPHLLMASLKMLARLIGEHKKFVFVSHDMEERGYLTLGHALQPGKYAIIRTLESDSAYFVERWSYPNEQIRSEVLAFVRQYCRDILIGLFRSSEHAPPCFFFAHREHVHVAAHIVMADSLIHPRRGFPMLLEVADSYCRGMFGTDSFQGLSSTMPTRAWVANTSISTNATGGGWSRYGG